MAKWKLQDEQQLIHRKKGTEKVQKMSSGKGKSTGKKKFTYRYKNTPYTSAYSKYSLHINFLAKRSKEYML